MTFGNKVLIISYWSFIAFHWNFSPSIVLTWEIKKLFKNVQLPELCSKMILLELTIVARNTENNHRLHSAEKAALQLL